MSSKTYSLDNTTKSLVLKVSWFRILMDNRWLIPFLFPILTALFHFTGYEHPRQTFLQHLIEWQQITVYVLSALFSSFIWYTDKWSNDYANELITYKDKLEKIPTDISVFNENHEYIYVNPAAISNQQHRDWIIGRDDFEYFQHLDCNLAGAAERRSKFKQALETRKRVSWIDNDYRGNQSLVHTKRTYLPVFDGNGKLDKVFGFGLDVTELIDLKDKDEDLSANMRYANQIQQYLLPNLTDLKQHIGVAFSIWEPRDVVSGDFYWTHRKDGTNYVAVADCTGHGVSGALLTVICTDTLNRCINEFELTSPADILNKSQELLTLSWTENGKNMLTDGMDVCLCSFKDDVLTFSSAASLLYHLRDEALVEYKGKKISIGQRWKDYVFTDSHISLNDGDKLYFATDGIADQFGGNNDKKYGRPRLRAAIDEIGSHPFERQELLFRHCFNQWSGESDQVDDKTFVGLEYSSVLTKEKTHSACAS